VVKVAQSYEKKDIYNGGEIGYDGQKQTGKALPMEMRKNVFRQGRWAFVAGLLAGPHLTSKCTRRHKLGIF
jgi:hypothetical protein